MSNKVEFEKFYGIPAPDSLRRPMDERTYLLVKLQEECLEVAHAVSKAITFGLGERLNPKHAKEFGLSEVTPSNQERMSSEIIDVLTIIDMLATHGVELGIRHKHKTETYERAKKVSRYARYSEVCGTLEVMP